MSLLSPTLYAVLINQQVGNSINIISLSHKDFLRLSEFIQKEYGIKMPEAKKTLLESRLQKRLRFLKIKTFKEYCDYLFSPEGLSSEIPYFIDKITTNKTEFFREGSHFDFLTKHALPEIIKNIDTSYKEIKLWSAGCSTGEEPYTLAMVLNDYTALKKNLNLHFSILATDISMEVLQTAHQAVYHESRAEPIPLSMKKRYLLKSKVRNNQIIKITSEIRNQVKFLQLNFMETDFGLKQRFDIIFCRNVIIYFDKLTQEKILKRILNYLVPGGYFFQGHSESIQGMKLPLKPVYPTVYIKTS